jgi:hypothetical protein
MNVSEIVTIRVKSPLWERREAFAYPIPEFETYTGTVLPSPSWVAVDQICISTGNAGFPFRVIEKARIVGCVEAREKPEEKLYQIEGNKGKLYPVTLSRGVWSCPCTGFGYRRSCSHVVIAKSKLAENVSSKETIFFEKKQNEVLTSSTTVVEYMGKVETGNGSPYKMKVKTMAKVKSEVKVTKTSVVIDIMTKHAGRPADEVARIIETQLPCREGYGKTWYRWAVKEGVAPGVLGAKASSKVKASKPTKVKLEKSVRSINAAHKAKVELNVDEIAKIKEANLERMREVSAKLKPKGKVRDYGTRVAADDGDGVADFDPTLAREEVNAILRDERLLDVCPKFVREDA